MNFDKIKKQNDELKNQLDLEAQQEALETPESLANDIKNDKLRTIRAKNDFIGKISGDLGAEMMKNPNAAVKIEKSWWQRVKITIITKSQ